jgi:hypothetical protein
VTKVTDVAQALQTVLTRQAEQAARDSGLCRRRSPLGGAVFAQAMVFGCLGQPLPTLDDFVQAAAVAGATVSPQAFDDRFGRAAADCLQRLLAQAVGQVLATQPDAQPLLAQFSVVAIQDSSTVALPDGLEEIWPGSGGRSDTANRAAVKLQVRLDLRGGQLTGPFLEAGRAADGRSVLQTDRLPKGSLRLADLGYFDLDEFARLLQDEVYVLSRLQPGTALYDRDGRRLDLLAWLRKQADVLDVPVQIGAQQRLAGRLIAIRVPRAVARRRQAKARQRAKKHGRVASAELLALCRWTLLVTTIPVALAGTAAVVVLARCRWQIELLFKVWKSDLGLGQSRSTDPWRMLCEVYAKLIAAVVQHWLVLAGGWQVGSARSYRKSAKAARKQATLLCAALADRERLLWVLHVTVVCQSAGVRMHKSRKDPRTYQLLEQPAIFGHTP